MKYLFFTAMLLASSFASAEQLFSYGAYPDGAKIPVFGEKVNLRTGPSTANDLVMQLAAGTKVEILSKSPETFTQNNYTENWYQVKAFTGKKTVEGFIWGGFLAKAFAVKDFNGDGKLEIIAAGILRCDVEFTKWGELRMIANGKVTARVVVPFRDLLENEEAKSSYRYSSDITLFAEKINALHFCALESIYEACDYPNYSYLFATDGKKIILIDEKAHSAGEAGGLAISYIFPGKPGGKKERVAVREHSYLIDENGQAVSTDPDKVVWFRLTGDTFTKENEEQIEQ